MNVKGLGRLYKKMENESGKKLVAFGDTVPTDADSGYAKGCIFVKTDGGVGTVYYINEGSDTSCDFNAAVPNAAQAALLADITATAAELNQLDDAVIGAMTPGSGVLGTATAAGGNVVKKGPIFKTEIFIDLTGLKSAAAGDIIGKAATANCHLGLISAAKNGTIVYGQITCLETPAGGDPDVDFYGSVTEGTGTQDVAISTLTGETLLLNNGDWTGAPATPIAMTALPGPGYLYAVDGGGTAVVYTAGQFLIELWGV